MHELIDWYQLSILLILQTQYADLAFFKDRPRALPSMTNPVIYATISGASREPMYGNIGEHNRQAAGKQHAKFSCTCTSRTVHRHSIFLIIFFSIIMPW